ncbi:MAG: DUF5107 domain-containing protein [Firmicutes bacterium]|nr:DUF5107 domain-containing protein [Bacillota bacterium]
MRIEARHLLFVLLAAVFVATTAAGGTDQDSLRIYDSTTTFRHFAFEAKPDHTMLSYDRRSIVETVFRTKVIENEYLKVTLLPEYGGRILSLIYKPTGHEELYQNPVGLPYGMGEGNFYYDWLMVYGGIFPTFPEPEHGKTWCLPWETRVAAQTPEKIGVEMRFHDDIAPTAGVPRRFDKGKTEITCTATVWVFKDKPYIKLQMRLSNTQARPLDYEYWTCATLAPGSEPGRTMTPANTEMIVPIDRVRLKDDWWPWMGAVETPIDPRRHVFAYKNLALFANWADMGIAYAYHGVEEGWWGVVNHTNEEGLFRVAENRTQTPGLKFWTWGYKRSYAADPNTFGNPARPYVELWAGHSREFFIDARLDANEEKSWDEYYIPTVGLPRVTYANRDALVYLHHSQDDAKDHAFTAMVFTTRPGESMELWLRLNGAKEIPLYHDTFTGDPGKPLALSLSRPAGAIGAGKYTFALILKSTAGETLAETGIPVEVK